MSKTDDGTGYVVAYNGSTRRYHTDETCVHLRDVATYHEKPLSRLDREFDRCMKCSGDATPGGYEDTPFAHVVWTYGRVQQGATDAARLARSLDDVGGDAWP